MNKRLTILMILSVLTGFAYAKESEEETSSLRVRLTDSPGDFLKLDVSIERVEVFLHNRGWVSLNIEKPEIDVIALSNGSDESVAFRDGMKSGKYTKIKFVFGDVHKLKLNSVSSEGSEQIDLLMKISDEYKHVILDTEFEIAEGKSEELLIDFDATKSVNEDGADFILTPALSVMQNEDTGVRGKLNGSLNAAMVLVNGSSSYSAYADENGEFLLRGITPGIYDLQILPGSDPSNPFLPAEKVIKGIVITTRDIKDLGSIEL